MAIYHLEAKVIGRSTGRSAVAASAYMSCSKILNDYDGVLHDFTRKRGLVWEHIFLPENSISFYPKMHSRSGKSGANYGTPLNVPKRQKTADLPVSWCLPCLLNSTKINGLVY